ncbi:MAG: acyl-CoA carboxylase subunit beta [Dehalococcoidales bacterium]|nr:acyl-CoA carboxylase subunit beta [Dehalococcoidales bacterium]
MSTPAEKINDFKKRKAKILEMGGADAVEKQHKDGKWSVRERVEYFFDPGTFTEIGMWVKHRTTGFGLENKEIPAEGVVTGFGKVNGRHVVVAAEDYTAMAGTFGEGHGRKFTRAMEFAKEKGWPFISINDSGGARLQEGMDTLEAYGWLFRSQILASGIVPQIAMLLGPCLGGQAYHPVMQDFLIQSKKGGYMGIAGPAFVKTQLGEEITLEQLSGWRAHAVKSGCTHLVAEDDKACLDMCKELLAFLPSNNAEEPPRIACNDDPERLVPQLDSVLPEQSTAPYDMKPVIRSIVDDGYFFEIMENYAKNLIIGFGRMNGRTVGIVADQPAWMSGVIDVNASDKGARFIRFCDLFNIPLISLQDAPGYLIGSDQDWKGILRHGAKMLYAWADATVPLICIMLRKSYAGAHFGMLDKSIGADFVFAWPSAQITIVGAETAASVIFAREIKNSPNPAETKAKRIEEYSNLYENPYVSAERGYTDDVILPNETRKILNRALDALTNKNKDNKAFNARPWRKYSNINL